MLRSPIPTDLDDRALRGLGLPLITAAVSGSLYAVLHGATVTEAIAGGVIAGLIVAGVGWLAGQPTPTAFARQHLPTFRKWLGHAAAPPPSLPSPGSASSGTRLEWAVQVVGRDVYLAITNHAGTTAFSAAVERIEGTADPLALPFSLRWRDGPGEHRRIATDDTSVLPLVVVEPEGNVSDYPIEHGASTKHSVEARIRGWKPGRFRFQGLSQEYAVFLYLGDLQPLAKDLGDERYRRRLRVTVRLRSSDKAVNEARTVVLGIQQVGQSRLTYGQGDAVVAEIEAKL